ncbi:Ig lambda chain C region [Anabarilius grahami]|uniref:Ig lambda chain C region n=1 Tax=Anabarilius grahami TaxID=495550 RepID=A0A3N0Z3H2_ANAGA|nr:Ig lambda chain C region [Anabarilius grahami]
MWAGLLHEVGGSFSGSSLSELLTVLKFLSLIISALFYSTAHLYTSHGPNHKMITISCAFFTLLTCVSGVTVVTQSPLITVNKGQTATLDCNLGTVTDFPLAPPVVTLLSPSTEALKESKATLVCLAEDISVALVHVSWTVNGRSVTDGVWSSATEKQQDKTFKMSSYLTIDSSDWINNVDFSCQVSVGSKFTMKRISNSQCY